MSRDARAAHAMRKLGLSRLLQLIALVPLLAMVAFGAVLIADTLAPYRDIERLSTLEQLVTAATRLSGSALNVEARVSQAFVDFGSEWQRAEMIAARRGSDAAVRAFAEAAALAQLSDPKARAIIDEIAKRLDGLKEFRAHADARSLVPRETGNLLQPITSRVGDLFQQMAHVIKQGRLSELLLAMHAIVQLNDGERIERGRSDDALRAGSIDPSAYQVWLLGLAKQSIF